MLIFGLLALLSLSIAVESYPRLQRLQDEIMTHLSAEVRSENATIAFEMTLQANHSYKIEGSLHDWGTVAHVVGNVTIVINGEIVRNEFLVAHNEDEHENSRVSPQVIYWFEAEEDSALNITGILDDGKEGQVRVFRDLPRELDTLNGLHYFGVIGGGLAFGLFAVAFVPVATHDRQLPRSSKPNGENQEHKSGRLSQSSITD